jgi:multicomponent Na+:H+ antiporter subunit A
MATLLYITLFGFALAALAPLLHRALRDWTGVALAIYPIAVFAVLASFPPEIYGGEAARARMEWVPGLDLAISFRLDGLSLIFGWLISGIGALVLIYASGYMKGKKTAGRLYAFLLFFMASMLGVVFADNLVVLYVFWELTSISSYLLIGFNHETLKSRQSALQSLLITASGGLALLAGLVLLGMAAGSFELSGVIAARDAVHESPFYVASLVLILLGCFTKSAQFPFHTWLPNAMEAPTPVSAYLHSATMVKAGVYLLARLSPAMWNSTWWLYGLAFFGVATTVVASVLALFATDLKRILAYTTVAALGMMTVLLSFGTATAAQACLAFLIGHALYKGALFMIAGSVDHETGTRDVRELGGLRQKMPATFGFAVVSGLALAGLGPFLSFIGKELAYETALADSPLRPIYVGGFLISAVASVTLACVLVLRVFWGPRKETPKKAHEAPWTMLLGPGVLSVAGLASGLLAGLIDRRVVSPAIPSLVPIGALEGTLEPLAVWHGFNVALALTLVGAAVGLVGYWRWESIRGWGERMGGIVPWGPQRWYEWSVAALLAVAGWLAVRMQSGYLRYYITIILLTTLLFVGSAIVRGGLSHEQFVFGHVRIYEAILGIVILGATLAAVRATTRISAVASLGVVGLSVSLIYVLFGAPDLAMTQFAVESLTVILLVLVFYHLPRISTTSGKSTRFRDAVVAIAFGAMMSVMVLLANASTFRRPISDEMARMAYPEAFGRNVVNVILVDFRGLDTLGEIVVLALAAIGVYALVKLRPHEKGGGSSSH